MSKEECAVLGFEEGREEPRSWWKAMPVKMWPFSWGFQIVTKDNGDKQLYEKNGKGTVVCI